MWIQVIAFITSIVLGIGLVLFLEFMPKKSRLQNRTGDFIKYKDYLKKDGAK